MATNWELNRNTKNIELNYDKLHEFDSHWTDPEGLGTCFKKTQSFTAVFVKLGY